MYQIVNDVSFAIKESVVRIKTVLFLLMFECVFDACKRVEGGKPILYIDYAKPNKDTGI